MVVSDRIRELARDKGMNIKEFSSFLGVSDRTIQNYLAGISLPNGRFLTDLSVKIGASPTWILVGEGPKYHTGEHQNIQVADGNFIPIPRFDVRASAGHGALINAEEAVGYYAYNRSFLKRRGLLPDMLAVIQLHGDSMEPDLWDGDLLLVNRAETTPEDSLIYAVRFDDNLFAKRIQALPGGGIQLLSSNPRYPPIPIGHGELDGVGIIGRVVNSTHEW